MLQKPLGKNINWQELNQFVQAWAAQHALPADLNGKQLLLVDFENDKDCEYFYPGRTQFSQQAFTIALARLARNRHARTAHVTVTPEHYRAWLMAEGFKDSPENRLSFIESRYKLLPLK